MIPATAWRESTVQKLRRVLIGTAVVWVAVSAWLGIGAYLASSRKAHDDRASKAHQASLTEMRSMVARANAEKSNTPEAGFGSVASFQGAVEAAAGERNCTVTEFQAGAEIMPFLTRFKKDTPQNEWGQVEVQFSVRGKLVDVVDTIRTFDQQAVPFEFNSIEFSRADVDKSGAATVSAKVSLRVVTRFPEGGSA